MSTFFMNLPTIVYVLIVLLIIRYVQKSKEVKNAETYALGNKSYGTFGIFATITATMIGPGFSIGVGEKAFSYGFFFTVFYSFALIHVLLFGYFFSGKVKKEFLTHKWRTLGDLIETYYGKDGRYVVGFITVLQTTVISGLVSLGGAKVLNSLWGIDLTTSTLFVALFVASYCIIGGMPAVLKTDVLQLSIMSIIGFAVLWVAGGILLRESATLTTFEFWNNSSPSIGLNETISIAIAFLLGEAFIPVYTIRTYISKDGTVAKKGFAYAAVFGLVWFIVLSIGGIATHFVSYNADVEITFLSLMKNASSIPLINSFLFGLLAAGLLAIVMSTLDSILNSGSVASVRDLLSGLVKISDEQEYHYSKIMLFLIAVGGVVFAVAFPSIVKLLILAYTLWAPTVVLPIAIVVLKPNRRIRQYSFLVSAIAGIIGYYAGAVFQYPAVLTGLIANFIAFLTWQVIGVTPIVNSTKITLEQKNLID